MPNQTEIRPGDMVLITNSEGESILGRFIKQDIRLNEFGLPLSDIATVSVTDINGWEILLTGPVETLVPAPQV